MDTNVPRQDHWGAVDIRPQDKGALGAGRVAEPGLQGGSGSEPVIPPKTQLSGAAWR